MSSIIFDQYQRYHLIEKLIRVIAVRDCRILEVGANASPLAQLLSEYRTISIDSDPQASNSQVHATGLHLPFKDGAFQIVVSTDVIEHMSSSDRIPFVQELNRVSSSFVILGFPHASVLNSEADRLFYDFIKNYSGLEFDYLNEHLKYGLPNAELIQKQLESCSSEVITIKNANVSSWILMQVANFMLSQHPNLATMRVDFNNFFNQYLEPLSHESPEYRTFFVASKLPIPAAVRSQLQEFNRMTETQDPAREYAIHALTLVSVAEKAIREKSDEIRDLEVKLKQQEERSQSFRRAIEEADKKVQHYALANQSLQSYLNLFLNHPVYKVYKFSKESIHKLLGSPRISPVGDIAYLIFQKKCEPDENALKKQSTEWQHWPSKPVLNLVTAVFNPQLEHFHDLIDSVLRQTYGNWIWNVVDASTDDGCWQVIQSFAQKDPRIQTHRLQQNEGISGNLNVALEKATGDYVVFMDHDDTLAPSALFAVAKAITENPEIDFVYSDADKLDESGRRCEPLFKPDWSPEMMLCCNLMNQISVFRRNLLEQVGFLDPRMDGAQDWDLYLRVIEATDRVHHIPQILYHWRKTPQSCAQRPDNKPYAKSAQIAAIQNHLVRIGRKNAEVAFDFSNPVHSIHPMSSWKLSSDYEVSVIIPSSDHVEVLSRCMDGLLSGTAYNHFRVILVDTASKNPETFDLYKKYEANPRFQLLRNDPPFNFGKACNLGAAHAKGSLLLFLNNDIEILHPDWLDRMVQWFEIPQVGAVGPKLLYPNGKIQHAGIIVGLGGLAGHLFLGCSEHSSSIFGSDDWYRNFSAITGACMLIRKEAFERAGGFDENYQLSFSDVHLCLRIKELGYRIVYTPQARLLHHESQTHGRKLPRNDFEYANANLAKWLSTGDPYFNPNVSYRNPLPHFRNNPEDSCADTNRVLMRHLPETRLISLPVRLPQKRA